ncbi:MAG: serine O-acetyltransferase [Planctomycetota bacterium]
MADASDTMSLRAQLHEDWLTNGEDRSRPGYRALRMYRFGVWRMSVKPRLLRAPLSLIYRMLHRRVRNRYGIELHYTARIGRRFLIAHQGAIVIHEHATIGDDCLIRQGVTIGAAGTYSIEDAPVLGDRVSVGAGAMILGRVTIGDDVTIGPNAVVMSNVPAGAMVVAPPARVIPAAKPATADAAASKEATTKVTA